MACWYRAHSQGEIWAARHRQYILAGSCLIPVGVGGTPIAAAGRETDDGVNLGWTAAGDLNFIGVLWSRPQTRVRCGIGKNGRLGGVSKPDGNVAVGQQVDGHLIRLVVVRVGVILRFDASQQFVAAHRVPQRFPGELYASGLAGLQARALLVHRIEIGRVQQIDRASAGVWPLVLQGDGYLDPIAFDNRMQWIRRLDIDDGKIDLGRSQFYLEPSYRARHAGYLHAEHVVARLVAAGAPGEISRATGPRRNSGPTGLRLFVPRRIVQCDRDIARNQPVVAHRDRDPYRLANYRRCGAPGYVHYRCNQPGRDQLDLDARGYIQLGDVVLGHQDSREEMSADIVIPGLPGEFHPYGFSRFYPRGFALGLLVAR